MLSRVDLNWMPNPINLGLFGVLGLINISFTYESRFSLLGLQTHRLEHNLVLQHSIKFEMPFLGVYTTVHMIRIGTLDVVLHSL